MSGGRAMQGLVSRGLTIQGPAIRGQGMRLLATVGVLALLAVSARAQSADPVPAADPAADCAPGAEAAPDGCPTPAADAPAADAPAADAPAADAPAADTPAVDAPAEPLDPVEAARARYLAGEYEEGFKAAFPYAQQGNAVAQNLIGNAYFYGHGVVQDCKLAEKWTLRAADQGLDRALFNYARMKHSGCYGDGVDPALALDYYQRAEAAGFAPSYAWQARLLASGLVGTPDPVKIRDLLDRGIAAGQDNAAQALADLQAEGLGLPRDQAAAVAWYRATALASADPEATWGLARQYLAGIGAADPDRVAAYALIYEMVYDDTARVLPAYARLLIENPGDYWHDPVEGWAYCIHARDVIGPEFFVEADTACEALRPLVAIPDLMKAALRAARWN